VVSQATMRFLVATLDRRTVCTGPGIFNSDLVPLTCISDSDLVHFTGDVTFFFEGMVVLEGYLIGFLNFL